MLITGGAGFLGRYLAAMCAAEEWVVTVLDDLSCINSTFQCGQLQHPNIQCVKDTTADTNLIRELIADHEVVVHFASIVGVEETISKPVETVRNLLGTLNIAEALTPEHVVIFGSSADVYGLHSEIYDQPMREEDLVVFESASVNRWVYPKVKALEENLIQQSQGVSINLRIFNCYGPDMDYPEGKRVIPQFIKQILDEKPIQISGTGEQIRAFCYYEDTLRGIMLAVKHGLAQEAPYSQTINIGNPQSLSIIELANLMLGISIESGLLEERLPIQLGSNLYSNPFNDSWDRIPDTSYAKKILGFEPTVELSDGLRRTLAYYNYLRLPIYSGEYITAKAI